VLGKLHFEGRPLRDLVFEAIRYGESAEVRATLASFSLVLMLMGSYYILRPVRDAMASQWTDAEVSWLCCRQTCIPGDAKLSVRVPVAERSRPANASLFDAWRGRLPVNAADPDTTPGLDVTTRRSDGGRFEVVLSWDRPAFSVDVFPATGRAVELEDLAIEHEAGGRRTVVRFTADVYDAQEVPGGTVRLLVVRGDGANRTGIYVPVRVVRGGSAAGG